MTRNAQREHKTDRLLAAALGVDPKALRDWREKVDGYPKTRNEAEWRAFMVQHDLGVAKNKPAKGREELLREKLSTEVRLNNLKIAKEERKIIPAAEVDDFHSFISARFKSGLYQMVSESAPKLAGKEVADVRGLLREAADMLLLSFQNLITDWQEEQKKAAEAVAAVDA
jgi:hypothetical protein